MREELKVNTIANDATISAAMRKFNTFGTENALILFVVDKEGKILGSISDGDIRRALTNEKSVDTPLIEVMNPDFRFIENTSDYVKLKEFKRANFKIIPFLDSERKIIELIDLQKTKAMLPLDAVIMAGGKGVRLQPYTNTCPKPMLELDDKPIIAHNIDRLIQFGVRNFYISVNYLKEQIIEYIGNSYNDIKVNFHFIEEDKPLGTLGSVSLVESFLHDDIIVMNSDILTNIDFEDFYLSYKEEDDAMSVATFNTKVDIPYGVLETDGKYIVSLLEKPSYTYYSNAGIYLIKKEHINKVPKNTVFNTTDFMELLIEEGNKVSHFPIRGYWLDIGNAANYSKAQDDVMYINF